MYFRILSFIHGSNNWGKDKFCPKKNNPQIPHFYPQDGSVAVNKKPRKSITVQLAPLYMVKQER